ncbi:hypothetical protein INT47_001104 [Mucor saturninus]|uniref:C2H2-type domain-containing protein n=1 Tax=Mucor saturninus TaxID=64648 RepID=A0A8H7RNM0_9FUNG|nr:hypothetical protein INT47_001104 [Mucor saturninus]
MLPDEDQVSRIFACPQCPKIFATRSNLKRHMENPNIHNIPYVRSRDQKRWKGHSKKVVSKEETTESNNDRMRKWRAENREKNRQNDLRCRVYRLARQKYGENDSSEKQGFVREEIARRLGRRMMMERREANGWTPPMRMRNGIRMMSPVHFTSPPSSPLLSSQALLSPLSDLVQLPFYSAPQQKIELPSIDSFTRTNSWSSSPPDFSSSSNTSSPILPHLSPTLQRRTSSSSISSASSITTQQIAKEKRRSSSVTTLSVNTTPIPSACSSSSTTPITPKLEGEVSGGNVEDSPFCVLPSMHAFLSYAPSAGVSSSHPAAAASAAAAAASVPTAAAAAAASSSDADNKLQQQKQQQNSSCCIPTITTKGGIKYVDSNKILDEFVGVVLNYVDNATVAQ